MLKLKYKIEDGRAVILENFRDEHISVYKGERFNGYSLPKYLWWFHRPLEGDLIPSIYHDKMLLDGNNLAHSVFRDKLKEAGFKQPKRQVMYLAVRLYQSVFYPDIFK